MPRSDFVSLNQRDEWMVDMGIPANKIIATPGRVECPLCFVNVTYQTPYEAVPIDKFLEIFEKIWTMESPSLDTLCTTCLQDLYHYKFGRSCEDIEKEENYETLSLSTNELNSRIHRDYCRHGKCILKFENSWKWIIKDAAVKNAFDMMNTAIRMVEGHVDCKLRRDRMDCTIRALERIQENKEIGMRTQGAGFEEDIAGKMQRADRLLKSLKAQWAEFRFGIQLDGSSSTPFGIQCSCTKIHEHYVEIFLELPLQEQFGDKYDTVGNEFREIANYKLDEIISECPVNFQRGFEVPRIVDVYGKIVTLQ